jgi:hypothetical protein
MKKAKIKQNFDRFKDMTWFSPQFKYPIIIGGMGNIGSYLAFYLSRLGFKIYGYDNDIVEEVNFGGQLYSYSQIGKKKVAAVGELVKEFSNSSKFVPMDELYLPDSMISPFMFSAFDNMESRATMFKNWRSPLYAEDSAVQPIFIDGRTTIETGIIFCVTQKTANSYVETLELSKNLPDMACSAKATAHNGAIIASFMAGCFVNHLTNMKSKKEVREVPFKINYELPSMTFLSL